MGIGGEIYLRDMGGPFVNILMLNNSNQEIKSIQLLNEGKIYPIEGLKKGLKKDFKLQIKGETSYSLEIEFIDEKRIRGGRVC